MDKRPWSGPNWAMIDAPKSESSVAPHQDGFGSALRFWRGVRRMSQLDLALEAAVSARHISFLESGRAAPSRAMVLQLAEALLLQRVTRNQLLTLAGFATTYPATPLESEALAPLRAALQDMMDKHAPWPAMLCDRHWNVLRANPAAEGLLSSLGSGPSEARNVVSLVCESAAATESIINIDEVRWELLGRIRLEILEAGDDPALRVLEEQLKSALGRAPLPQDHQRRPLVPLQIRAFGRRLSFLTAIAHFGTSDDVAVRDLRLELLFPADDATRAAFA